MADSVRASHILVKHRESRRLGSWRDPDGNDIRKRTKEQAHIILTEYREAITTGKKTFAEIARTESDCSSATSGGDLGDFGRGEMNIEFEECAFALKVGEVSEICDSSSGSHLILRTA